MRLMYRLAPVRQASRSGTKKEAGGSHASGLPTNPSSMGMDSRPCAKVSSGGNAHSFAALNHLAQFVEREVLELADAFTRDTKFLADFLQ